MPSGEDRSDRASEILEVLTDRERRSVLYHLQEETVADVDDVARTVAAATADVPPDGVDERERSRVHDRLVHLHLPKMVDAGLVEWDRRSGTVRYAHPPDVLSAILRLVGGVEPELREV